MSGLIDPFESCEVITPSDDEELTHISRAVYIPYDGNMAVITTAGSQVTFEGLKGGTLLPGQFRQILATGTSVSGSLINCW